MLQILLQLVPDNYYIMAEAVRSPHKAVNIYQNIDSWNFSTRVLTRIPQDIIILEIDDVSWSDWGTRESIERTYRALDLVPFWKLSQHQANSSRQDSSNRINTTQFID